MLTTNTQKYRWMLWLGLSLLFTQASVVAETDFSDIGITERIEWKKIPIRLDLTVGKERLVSLPVPVKVGVPAAIQPLLRTQSVNGTVYLLAHAPFDMTRLMVREVDSGQIYLLDVTASKEGGHAHPVQVFVNEAHQSGEGEDTATGDAASPNIGYVTLTRFAAQQLYAPARLLHEQPGIVRIPVGRDSIDLVRGGAIEARPLVAWRAGGYFITAVKLSNRTRQPQTLDPRDLRGAWLTATFQHNRLLPAGNEADTTAVYLISARPFEASL